MKLFSIYSGGEMQGANIYVHDEDDPIVLLSAAEIIEEASYNVL
ncbi:hypothetical protein [Sphingopyxis sp.]|nr:hypothetical protein [Sphingopyxis sp.]